MSPLKQARNLPVSSHSGVAWARNVANGEKTTPKEAIRVIKNWPVVNVANSDTVNVSSCISYKADGSPDKYGYLAERERNVIKWVKVLLDASNHDPEIMKMVEKSNILLKELNKTPKDVVRDYLSWIWDRTLADINRHSTAAERNNRKFKVVLAIPAIWSHDAKSKMLQAARAAKLPDNIQLVTEPEAAALAVLTGKENIYGLEVC